MSVLKANDFWRPRQTYVSTDRYKSLLVHDNKFYICTESHQAGETFEENIDKFQLTSGSGGGLIPQGDWDIVNSTQSGENQNLPAVLSVSLDSQITNNIVYANQPLTLFDFAGSGFFGYGATTTNHIINNFSTTKWITLEGSNVSSYYQFFVLYSRTNTDVMTDIIFNLLNGNLSNKNMLLCGIASFGSPPQVTLVYEGNGHTLTPITGSGLPTTSHNNISVGLNLALGKIYFDNTTEVVEYNIPTDLFANVSDLCLFVGGLKGGPIAGDSVSLINPDPINKPPLLEDLTTYVTVPPVGATDGSVWKATSNGTFVNTTIKSDDYVSFYQNLTKVLVLADNNAELNVLTNAITVANDDITVLQESAMTLQERAIVRGIIDYATNVPTTPLKGNTFLASSTTTGDFNPYILYVYTGTSWVDVNPKEGNIFNFSEFNIQIMYKTFNDSSRAYKHTKRTTNLNSNVINIVDLINELGNTHWYIFNNVKPTGYISQGDCIQSSTIFVDFNVYKDCLIDLSDVEFSTFNMSLNYIPTSDLLNIDPNTLYFTNSTNSTLTIHFDNNYLNIAIPKAPLLSNDIDIPPHSQLVLNVRPIDRENHSVNEYSIEYVSGSYVKSTSLALGTTGGVITVTNGITDFYINVDDTAPLSIQMYINNLPEGQVFNMIYNASAANSDISLQIHNNSSDYSVYLPIINIGDKGNKIRFANSTFEIY